VSHFHFKPGDETGWHKHEYPYFVVYLTDCKLLHMPRNAPEAVIEHNSRDSRHIPPGVEHHVRSIADHDVELLEIEYKQ
jgi:quercetin dioxygenase-like cupin family protein